MLGALARQVQLPPCSVIPIPAQWLLLFGLRAVADALIATSITVV
jgi:hypothetical protein